MDSMMAMDVDTELSKFVRGGLPKAPFCQTVDNRKPTSMNQSMDSKLQSQNEQQIN